MWFKSRRLEDRLLTPVGALLVEESEAFLSGTFAQAMRIHGDAIPGWARLNVFAHGDLAIIEGLQGSDSAMAAPEIDEDIAWWSAQRALTAELVGLVDGDAELLGHVQRAVLVPLEFRLIQRETEHGLTARDLFEATRAALQSNIS